jgi:ATP-binding cassette subfamily B protein
MTAARAARLDAYIASLPGGYDTVLGERGVRMSGGQRQRLAIARALLRNPRLLLLDEATSALDVQTEKEILETLAEVLPGRTTISITHRLSVASTADHIILLDAGRVREQGTHRQLLDRDGLYAALYKEQAGYHAAGGLRDLEAVIGRITSIPPFSQMPGEALAALSQKLSRERYAQGEYVVGQGEAGDKLYIISRGELEVLVEDGGEQRRVSVLRDSQYFGEMALLTGEPRSASVRTMTASELYALSREDFLRLLESMPSVRQAVVATAAARRAALQEISSLLAGDFVLGLR